MPRILVHILLLLTVAAPAWAQDGAVLYAGLIKSKGYVVGSPLSASGLHRFEGDTTWTHFGWNTPRASGLAFDPTDPAILYVAAGNGCLRTMDGGASWRLTTDWRVTEAQDVAVDPNAPEHVYLATAYGLWRSEDRGQTWTEANVGIPAPGSTYTDAVEVDRAQAGRVLAATWGGLYVSEDGAQSWTHAGPPDVHALDLQQSPTAPNVWIAGTQDRGVLRSEDGGRTWRFAGGGLARKSIYAVAIDPFDAQRMAAAGWDTGVFLSADGGTTWTAHRRGLPTPHVFEVLFDANTPGRLWAATIEEGIFFTDDAGRSWQHGGLYGTMVFDMIFVREKG